MTRKNLHLICTHLICNYKNNGVPIEALEQISFESQSHNGKYGLYALLLLVFCVLIGSTTDVLKTIQGVRCLVPNNYVIWEATRPLANCTFCSQINGPIVLENVTRDNFKPYAYSSQPIIVKGAFLHWPALKVFHYDYFKNLYNSVEGAYDEVCQFLHLKSDFNTLEDVFKMDQLRVENRPGQVSWYVGWGNCHPVILKEMRRWYPKPHFLPTDCEMPTREYVFMGYEDGATLHLDFINRLMWQAQLKGTKRWDLVPPPECEPSCKGLTFVVRPGDAVLLDTRIWYHGTSVVDGFSLAIQSEYG